jgi:acetolactate synthase regulatory subunit
MIHVLNIQLRDREGAVLRALGLIERRGFRLHGMIVEEASAAGREMSVRVSSERPVELLRRQLERLHDVLRVEPGQAAIRWASAGTRN